MSAKRLFDGCDKRFRITTFVPPPYVGHILEGVYSVLAKDGQPELAYGQYDHVAWWSGKGTEQFRPLEGSNATSGSPADSVQLVFTIPRDERILSLVLEFGLIPNHPWEEPVVCIDECHVTGTKEREGE